MTTKLTKEERNAVTDFARSRGLAEILGVRVLPVNVIRPVAAGHKLTPEAFDKLLDEISTAKHEQDGKLASEKRR